MKRLIILIVFLIVLVAWFIFSTIDQDGVVDKAATEEVLIDPVYPEDTLNEDTLNLR